MGIVGIMTLRGVRVRRMRAVIGSGRRLSKPGGGPSPGQRARAPAIAISPARIAPSRG